jgi:hypothetical protein
MSDIRWDLVANVGKGWGDSYQRGRETYFDNRAREVLNPSGPGLLQQLVGGVVPGVQQPGGGSILSRLAGIPEAPQQQPQRFDPSNPTPEQIAVLMQSQRYAPVAAHLTQQKQQQSNVDRQFNFQVGQADQQQRNWQAQFERGETPQGFEPDPQHPGQLRPRRGGPADPAYIQNVNEVKEKPRVLNAGEITKLSEEGGKFQNILGFTKTFENRFAGRLPGTGDLQMAWGRYVPGAHKDNADGSVWWQGYDRYKNQVRNDLFGSALTATEQAAFEKADINPSMDPEQIKKNLRIQQDIVQGAIKRKAGALLAGGYDPRQIAAAYGLTPRDLSDIIGIDPALARNPNYRQYLQPNTYTQQQQPNSNLPRIGSRQEMMRLAPGTKFMGPDGKEWTVPPR